ncbi:hypothetical protein CBW65_20925 [Tumebacillus avium]|uniref:Cell wall-binding repeat 2 family protein n=1 Tax=Tumebacillus avium TaxID=1903704 RepID=A0A1Y0IT58_9BACL|nr:cell wall-binding repeat-containing protein [Tumebacillus avium]ARU63169.1 hypothetical protein CBW65_20925 [Tumebacillus avium]
MNERWHPILQQVSTTFTTRILCNDPVSAAIGIAQTVFPARRPNAVLLARPDSYPLALAAARLLHRPFDAVLLYTEGEQLEESVSRELIRLSPQGKGLPGQVIVLGAMHANVLHQLAELGFSAAHLIGHDQWDTVGKIAAFEPLTGSGHALLVSADPLGGGIAAGSFAAATGAPVLFASERGLSDMAIRFLRSHPRQKLIVAAPESYLPPTLGSEVRKLGSKIEAWIGGRDGYETSVELAKLRKGKVKFGFGRKEQSGRGLALVPADQWAFGAAAAALSNRGREIPLLLTRQDRLPAAVGEFLLELQGRSGGVRPHGFVVGSYEVISQPVQILLHRALARDGS